MGKRSQLIRAGPKWLEFESMMKKNIGPVSRPKFTDSVAQFIEKEGLVDIMVRRAKKKRKGGLF